MNSAAMYPPSTAPPANMFNSVPGYEGTVAGGGGYLPPPMPMEPVAPPQPGPAPESWTIPSLEEDVAREAFKSFASSHCCYNKAPAKDGVITKMEPFNTYRYRLETFTESRWVTHLSCEIRVPYTSSIKDCHTCHASGTMPCEECNGNGHKPCWVCNGAGTKNGENCTTCNGTGKDNCRVCDGHATKPCTTCNGKRQLLTFIQLKVEWTNHVDDHLVQQDSGLNVDDLRSVSGKELFKNNNYLIYPLLGFPSAAIGEASDRLIKEHQSKFAQNSRILQQRQRVELIPITKVNYKWKSDTHVYFVYGNEHQVSADNYPATCCCVVQ
ncbi:SSUH2-like [Solea senegalensis]|uniref:SSUH2-like n=1 Tax=Solea senegalensis TaxID=28829 RepID=A0AAV6QK92_SOLSE|nr:SSUH2-like [Solea senegalensis]